ncbi:hypothetical protein DFJ43DRAFT_1068241 [Lentinula guzmanii]|uniref:Uncharacterized protein n=1 Tax=Lentinula guzmanii TaxID=2804957 RepID=A0AA38JJD4_9AGAR|nr:hypothetical protein DFJ43DRAFT_1068241 [Lentinula guzmanii]
MEYGLVFFFFFFLCFLCFSVFFFVSCSMSLVRLFVCSQIIPSSAFRLLSFVFCLYLVFLVFSTSVLVFDFQISKFSPSLQSWVLKLESQSLVLVSTLQSRLIRPIFEL